MRAPAITDVCLVTRDLEPAIAFYVEKLGFRLAHRMPGFADFEGPGVTLALWDATAIRESTGVPAMTSDPDGHAVMVAVGLASPVEVDEMEGVLRSRGVEVYGPARDYPWTARALYLPGPCGELWELYAWLEGEEPGRVGEEPERMADAPSAADPDS